MNYAESAMVEFDITKRNIITEKLIREIVKTKDDLVELRSRLHKKRNKIFFVLCDMKREREEK